MPDCIAFVVEVTYGIKFFTMDNASNTGHEIINNIIYSNNVKFYHIYSYDKDNTTSNHFTSNNNIFYSKNTKPRFYTEGQDYTSLSTYQTATNLDLNSITSDPLFITATENNFHLLPSSPAIDAGLDIGLTEDFDGTSIPQMDGPDIGAFEFTPSTQDGSTFFPAVYLLLLFSKEQIDHLSGKKNQGR